ncbi:cell polarity protein [Blastomyces gilchristii SLH14081]|uniref:Cell polarity protein n=1 Tax=Blastomyces gilchristii (strain SLH14081) TaxID=559298 RepID=A0A179UMK5_BLAGS|nr:cell polarity protein [Blastomyces gilchristii SLH14081]OAT09204.1 cell polarity protein [Blastomyces gilchristii SLH14081]
MSPVSSTDGSEWSGVDRYQSMGGKSDTPQSPALPHGRSALASPPISASGGPPYSPLQMHAPDAPDPAPNGSRSSTNGLAPRRPSDMSQNPSPPSSVTSRSRASDGTLSDQRSKRYKMMEDLLLKHYTVLKRYLHGQGREDPTALHPNKARDKLLRLSPSQVMDLSTDVYDELLRRQAVSPNRPGGPRPDVPPYLPPRQEFHEKRNQARQVLSSLQQPRFRNLATDVLCELERRFPHFAGMDRSRRVSPAPSVRGGYGSGLTSNGYDPRPASNGSFGYGPNGYPAPPRTQSRGPMPQATGPGPGPGGRGLPPNPHQGSRFPPRQGSLSHSSGAGGGAPGAAGLGINEETIPENAPFPKSFQSNTIVPNKSTMVEEEEEEEDGDVDVDVDVDEEEDAASRYDDDNDPDRRSDAFALDKVLQSRRTTTTTDSVGVGVGVGVGGGGGSESDKQKLAEVQGQVSQLKKQIEELEKSKDAELETLKAEMANNSNAWDSERREWESMREDWNRAKEEWDKMKLDLEVKLSEAEDLNASLQDQLEGERREYEASEQVLQQQIQQALAAAAAATEKAGAGTGTDTDIDTDGGVWKSRAEDIERENQELREELRKQREVTEQVRKEASNFLQEMRALSERTQEQWEREERLTHDFQRMEEEVKIWKNRYAKTKSQLRHLRSSSSGLPGGIQDATTIAKDNDLSHPNGLVKDVHFTKFQMSIDELLRTARISEPAQVLEQMKAVVFAVRYITRDIENAQGSGADEHTQSRSRAKARVSATANNLITASKNFANSNGMSPVSLLDAAASHLTAAIIELVRTVKVRPTPADELGEDDYDDDNLGSMQSPAYFSVPPSLSRMSGNDSVYSAISSPHSTRSPGRTSSRLPPSHRKTYSSGQLLAGGGLRPGLGISELDGELEELRLYLEDQTEGVVQSIQALVSSIRAEPDDMFAIRTHIDAISAVVSKVIDATESAITRQEQQQQQHQDHHQSNNNNDNHSNTDLNVNNNTILRDRAGPIIRILSECRDRLAEAGAEGNQALSVSEMREVTGKLPPIAFQIARETKELVQRLDQMEMVGSGNHGGGGGGEGMGGGPIGGWRGAEDHDDDDDDDDDDDFR